VLCLPVSALASCCYRPSN